MSEFFDYSELNTVSPQVIQKKKLRRSANACGIALILLFAVMYGWAFPTVKIAAMFDVDLKKFANFLSEPFINQLIGILLSAIMVILPFFIAAKLVGVRIAAELPFKMAPKGLFIPSVLIAFAFCLFSKFAVFFGGKIFTIFGIEFPGTDTVYPNGFFGILISMLSTAFFPAFFEELALRGFALSILLRHGDMFAVISSAVIFGFMHANFDQIVFAFFVGLVLGFITVKTGSIWPAVTVHFLNNLNSVVFSYLSDKNEILSSLLLITVFAVSVFLAILGCVLLNKREPDYFKTNEEGEISFFQKLRWFLTTPTIIIGIVISLLIAFFAR